MCFIMNLTHILVLILCYEQVGTHILDLPEGDLCDHGNYNGTCVPIYRCLKAKTDIKERSALPICSFSGKTPVVCCTDCYSSDGYDFRDEVVTSHVGSLWFTGSVAENKFKRYLENLDYPCRTYLKTNSTWSYDEEQMCHQRSQVQTGSSDGVEFPRRPEMIHAVILGFGDEPSSIQWLCGGSIISETFVLSSATCISTPSLGEVQWVALGPLKVDPPAAKWQRYRVKRALPHPEYRPTSKYHDLALIEITEPFKFSNQAAPVSLTTTDPENPFYAVAWEAIGHGKSLDDTLASELLTSLDLYSEDDCSILFPPQPSMKNGYSVTTQLCFGYKGEKPGTCEGDMGSSIITKDDSACAYAVLGVTALGRTCGLYGGAVLYTRVRPYVPWIEQTVWPGPHFSYTWNGTNT